MKLNVNAFFIGYFLLVLHMRTLITLFEFDRVTYKMHALRMAVLDRKETSKDWFWHTGSDVIGIFSKWRTPPPGGDI